MNAYRFPPAIVGLCLIPIALVAIYWPGLWGPYIFDDAVNLQSNPAVALTQLDLNGLWDLIKSGDSGPLGRPIALVSFGLNHYLSGGFSNTLPFKTTNLGIHIVNAFLVYWLSLLLLQRLDSNASPGATGDRRWIAVATAALWALHPLQLTSVLYVVQRMTSLATLLVLAGLIVFLHGRQRFADRRSGGLFLMISGVGCGTLLGIFAKENAAVTPLLAATLEWVLFDRRHLDERRRRVLVSFYVATTIIPALGVAGILLSRPEIAFAGYKYRDFDMGERLLTESRVLWFYLSLLAYPDISRLGLFHDDLVVSRGFCEPWTTAIAALAWSVTIAAAILTRRRWPLPSLGLFWFLIAHSIESSILPLELVHEHRNYLPTIGFVFAFMAGLAIYSRSIVAPRTMAILLVLTALVLCTITYSRAHAWQSESSLARFELRHHPNSARAHVLAGEIEARPNGNLSLALTHFARAYELTPSESMYLLRMELLAAHIDIHTSRPATSLNTPGTSVTPWPFLEQQSFDSHFRLRLASRYREYLETALHEKAITAQTEQLLLGLADCVAENPTRCGHINGDVMKWLSLALKNPSINARVENNLSTAAARILVVSGDLAGALVIARSLQNHQPNNGNAMLMEADIVFRQGDRGRALTILDEMRAGRAQLTRQIQERADQLRTRIQDSKSQ